jgi:hypothetical protein
MTTYQIQVKRDTATNWVNNNPTLANGEWSLETDTGRTKLGDGATAYSSLRFFKNNRILTPGTPTATTYSISTDNYDAAAITAQTANISLITLTGTPTQGQNFTFYFTDGGSTGSPAAITMAFASSIISSGNVGLPSSTSGIGAAQPLRVDLYYSTPASSWVCWSVA